jgi:hypothetical protein
MIENINDFAELNESLPELFQRDDELQSEEAPLDVDTLIADGATPEWDGRAVETGALHTLSEVLENIEEPIFEDGDPKLERMADVVHQVWCNWMEYLFTKGWTLQDKGFKIDSGSVKRWKRQMKRPYAELSEDEKQSDRDIARRYLDLTIDFFLEEPHV